MSTYFFNPEQTLDHITQTTSITIGLLNNNILHYEYFTFILFSTLLFLRATYKNKMYKLIYIAQIFSDIIKNKY